MSEVTRRRGENDGNQSLNSSLMVTRIGNREYPQRSVVGCHTCQHPLRNWIETQLANGRAYTAIWRGLPEEHQAGINPLNIATHFKRGHLPLTLETNRAMIEQRAETVGKSIMESTESLLDHVSTAQTIMTRGYERMVSGEIEPDVKDMLAAAKFMREVEVESGTQFDQAAVEQAFAAFMDALRPELSPEAMARFGRRLDQNPILAALERKLQSHGRVVDGSAVDVSSMAPGHPEFTDD